MHVHCRELQRAPQVLISALPNTPADFAAVPLSIAPRPKTYKMIGMISVILSAIFVIMAGYLAVGFAGYLAFPTTVSSNVLNSFAADDPLIQVGFGTTSRPASPRQLIPNSWSALLPSTHP